MVAELRDTTDDTLVADLSLWPSESTTLQIWERLLHDRIRPDLLHNSAEYEVLYETVPEPN